MDDTNSSDFDAVSGALREIGSMEEAAEVHGTLCGLACVHGTDAQSSWLAGIRADAPTGSEAAIPVLEDLARTTITSLEAGDMSFSLLLPDDDETLESRTESLSYWCQGFMHGLGIARSEDGNSDEPVFDNAITQEIIRDFSEITRAAFSDEETEAEGDAAYIEIVEYVRVSAQLVYEELYPIRNKSTGGVH